MNTNSTTQDFYLAAYLMALGVKLHSHSRFQWKTSFMFNSNNETQEAINRYYNQQANDVDALSYASAVRALKSVVHSYDTTSNTRINNDVKQYKGIK